jgi:hypothetical protein
VSAERRGGERKREGQGVESRSSRSREIAALTTLAGLLAEDELAVVTLVAERLLYGRQHYGELRVSTDLRDFRREALEEAADMAVYAAAGLLRAGSAGRRARIVT